MRDGACEARPRWSRFCPALAPRPSPFAEIGRVPRRDRFTSAPRSVRGAGPTHAGRLRVSGSDGPTRLRLLVPPYPHRQTAESYRSSPRLRPLSRPAECPGNPPRPSCVLRHTGPASTAHPGSTQHQLCRGVHREGVRLGMSSKNRKRRPRKKGKKARTGMTGSQKAQIWRTALEMLPPLIWALAALINALTGR